MNPRPIEDWIDRVRGAPDSASVGMILVHEGIVRGKSRSGERVSGMMLAVDRQRLEEALEQARTWPGVHAVRAWVNEGMLSVGDPIMRVLVAGDVGDNVFAALQRLVSLIKSGVVSESEVP